MKQVAAAVIEHDGLVLIARRPEGDPLAGRWEFPGGRIEPDETPQACLVRELSEEMGLEIAVGEFLASSRMSYSHATIELHGYRARLVGGDLEIRAHSAVEWVRPEALKAYRFCEADLAIVRAIQGNPAGTETNHITD